MSFHPSTKLTKIKGPHGQTTFSDGRYRVTIHFDGAIQVKPGDWLSKYSVAMHGDLKHVQDFARMDRSGKLTRILNPHLIFAGEILYHIPTWRQAHPLWLGGVEILGSPLSDEEQIEITVKLVGAEVGLDRSQMEILDHIAHFTHVGDLVLHAAEMAEIIEEGTALATGASMFSFLGIAFVAVYSIIVIVDAGQTDKRFTKMWAVCYALTAWAFDGKAPEFPASLANNMGMGKSANYELKQVWKAVAEATVQYMDSQVAKKRRSKKSYQLLWQGLGDGDKRKLVRRLMEASAKEQKLNETERMGFWILNPDRFPN